MSGQTAEWSGTAETRSRSALPYATAHSLIGPQKLWSDCTTARVKAGYA